MARLFLVIFSLLILTSSCATPEKVSPPQPEKAPPPSPVPEARKTEAAPPPANPVPEEPNIEHLKQFSLKMLLGNAGDCLGPDGKNLRFLGRDSQLQLVLKFDRPIPPVVTKDNLLARIGDQVFHFVEENRSEMEFLTKKVEFRSLQPGIDTGPQSVSIYFRDRRGEVFLKKDEMLCIDTTAPPRPKDVRVTGTGPGYFSLAWGMEREPRQGEIKEYVIEKKVQDDWVAVPPRVQSTKAVVQEEPDGSYRVVAVDCALNKAASEEIWVAFISIRRKGCGENATSAYKRAKDQVTEEIVEIQVGQRLISQCGLSKPEVDRVLKNQPKDWTPPGIQFFPQEIDAKSVTEGTQKCMEIEGRLHRRGLEGWIKEKCRGIDATRRKGIRLQVDGPGSDILAGDVKVWISGRGFTFFGSSTAISFEPNYKLEVKTSLGEPRVMNFGEGLSAQCWDVQASISFTDRSSGQSLHLTLRDVQEIDARIYGRNLDEALKGSSKNEFPERIGKPFIKEFLKRLSTFLPQNP